MRAKQCAPLSHTARTHFLTVYWITRSLPKDVALSVVKAETCNAATTYLMLPATPPSFRRSAFASEAGFIHRALREGTVAAWDSHRSV